MKVIFTRDLKKVAKKGEIKEVKDGYAENFLIKNKYAVAYTEKNVTNFNKQQQEEKNLENKLREEATKLKKELEKLTLVFKVKTGDHDRVFGSISTKQIKEELLKKGYKLDKTQFNLTTSLQSLGFHKVEVVLYKDVVGELKVQLVK